MRQLFPIYIYNFDKLKLQYLFLEFLNTDINMDHCG